MVALGFFELGLWGEAIAVAEEGTVAVGLEVIGEFAQPKYFSFVLIFIRSIGK